MKAALPAYSEAIGEIFKSVPIPSYMLPRRRSHVRGLGTRMGSIEYPFVLYNRAVLISQGKNAWNHIEIEHLNHTLACDFCMIFRKSHKNHTKHMISVFNHTMISK